MKIVYPNLEISPNLASWTISEKIIFVLNWLEMNKLYKIFILFSIDIWILKTNPAYLHHVNGNGNEKVKESAKKAAK